MADDPMESYHTKVRGSVNVNKDKLGYMLGKYTNLSKADVKLIVDSILEVALDATIVDTTKWIRDYVAKDTGELQDNFIANLNLSKSKTTVNTSKISLKLGTNIDYAPYVNAMGTDTPVHYGTTKKGKKLYAKVRHHGEISSRSGRALNDPKAIGKGYWGQMRMNMRQRLKINLKSAIRAAASGSGISAKPLSDKLKVKGES